MKPIVALVGRPNVGKSTFLNRLIGQRKAIVEDIPGTTRDRLYGDTEWNGRQFTVLDTAGLLFEGDDLSEGTPQLEIARHVREQAQIAIAEADYVTIPLEAEEDTAEMTTGERTQYIAELEARMREAAKKFEFEQAAQIRDRIKALKTRDPAGAIVPA